MSKLNKIFRIKKTSEIFATSVTYLIPVVAIFWGLIDGEVISLQQLFSIMVILVGIYFINKFKYENQLSKFIYGAYSTI